MKIVLILAVLCGLTVHMYSATCPRKQLVSCAYVSAQLRGKQPEEVVRNNAENGVLCKYVDPYTLCLRNGCLHSDQPKQKLLMMLAAMCGNKGHMDSYLMCPSSQKNVCNKLVEKMKAVYNLPHVSMEAELAKNKTMCIMLRPFATCIKNGCVTDEKANSVHMFVVSSLCTQETKQDNQCSAVPECTRAVSSVMRIAMLPRRQLTRQAVRSSVGLCDSLKDIYTCLDLGCKQSADWDREQLQRVLEYCTRGGLPNSFMPASFATSATASVFLVLLAAMALVFQ
ncbi:uncharacterized protein LOC121373776 [Gigantopelta aegis]|uniref:uncharacterized protein LOC121373776 n=1 Tax=Gigantopelta aegis TaxID=1735272 RepID=UPI001B88D442|nr:uncharacterized protein LOC121373776 [Gigantopelta aegis]